MDLVILREKMKRAVTRDSRHRPQVCVPLFRGDDFQQLNFKDERGTRLNGGG